MTRRFDSPPTAAAPSRGPALAILLALGLLPLMCTSAHGDDTVPLPRTGLYRIIPERVRFPDGYKVDLQRDPSRFAEPVDTDTIAEVRFWSRPVVDTTHTMTMSFGIDDESKRIGSGGTLVHFVFEYRF